MAGSYTRFTHLAPILVLLSSACDGGDSPDDVQNQVVSEDSVSPTNMLATPILEVERGDYTLTFLETDMGIAVVEYAPVDAPPLLDALIAQKATAVELLHALAPDADSETKLAVQEASGEASTPAASVRDLKAEIGPLADGEDYTPGYVGTNCSLATDGADFDWWWDTNLNWNWHWYQYWTPSGNVLHKSAVTPARKKVRAHTCNNGSNEWYNWGVYRDPSAGCTGQTVYARGVEDGFRATYYQTGADDSCKYWTYAVNSVDGVPHSLGIMTP